MRAVAPKRFLRLSSLPRAVTGSRMEGALKPLVELAAGCDSLVGDSIGAVLTKEGKVPIPRFVFLGPKGGGDTIRLGVFGAFHGSEANGPQILARFLRLLVENPALAKGYHLFVYPICNPSGFELGERNNEAGQDLTEHFWRGSNQVEAYCLERELGVLRFGGVMSVHTHEGSEAGYVLNGRADSILHQDLAKAALTAAGVETATSGASAPGGFLTDTEELRPAPFEINWHFSASDAEGAARVLASILEAHRALASRQQNI